MSPVEAPGAKVSLRDWRLEDLDAYSRWLAPGHRWQPLDGLGESGDQLAYGRHNCLRPGVVGAGYRLRGAWAVGRVPVRRDAGDHTLRPAYLAGYVAMCKFSINLKRVTPEFISSLVARHSV